MRYRYTAPMDIATLLKLLDAMLGYINKSETEKQMLQDMVIKQAKIIEDFRGQMDTASTMLVTNEDELKQVHAKLSEIASLLLPDN